MDVVVIFNGLGNQMSQYAFYLAKKERNKRCILIFDDKGINNHNGYELDKLFNISIPKDRKSVFAGKLFQLKKVRFVSRFLGFWGVYIIKEDKNYKYRSELVNESRFGINFYWGGWPSEKHFMEIKEKVRKVFVFPEQDDKQFLIWKAEIDRTPNSVSLHIRRGDYLNKTNDMYQFGGVANMEYFNNSIGYISKEVTNPVFYIFSDDLDWCKEKFKGAQFRFVDCNRGENSWRDMYLMSLCRHHINSNSTFSWWGAWLSNFKDSITICPKEYIRGLNTPDVYPERWIKM